MFTQQHTTRQDSSMTQDKEFLKQSEVKRIGNEIERTNFRLRNATEDNDKYGAEIERRELLRLHRELKKIN